MIRKNSAYPLQPPRERGTWRAFALALVMHVLLGFFLYHGIQWQNSTPAGAEAELWTDVPDVTTPRRRPRPRCRWPPPRRCLTSRLILRCRKRSASNRKPHARRSSPSNSV